VDEIDIFNQLIELTNDSRRKSKLEVLRETFEFMRYHGAVRDKDLPWVFFLENDFNAESAVSAEKDYLDSLKKKYHIQED